MSNEYDLNQPLLALVQNHLRYMLDMATGTDPQAGTFQIWLSDIGTFVGHVNREFSEALAQTFPESGAVALFSASQQGSDYALTLLVDCYISNPVSSYGLISTKSIVVPIGVLSREIVTIQQQTRTIDMKLFTGIDGDHASPILSIPAKCVSAILHEQQLAQAMPKLAQIGQIKRYLFAMSEQKQASMGKVFSHLFPPSKKSGPTASAVIDPLWQDGLGDAIIKVKEAADSAHAAAVSI
jgi:hypothetical protein